MKIPILADLEKLVIEHGSAVIQEKHIALLKDKIGGLEKEQIRLEKANAKLVEDLAEANRKLERHTTPSEYVDWKGVLIKRQAGGGYSETPYCPTCKLPLSVSPAKMLFCSHKDCGYTPRMTIISFRDHVRKLT
jgi:hypothetical protein